MTVVLQNSKGTKYALILVQNAMQFLMKKVHFQRVREQPFKCKNDMASNLGISYSILFEQLEGELQRENKLISYERAFKMPENDMYISVIGQAVLEL